jgi:aryl-alcohol dehydrogenase-like predicted oxidoreductase
VSGEAGQAPPARKLAHALGIANDRNQTSAPVAAEVKYNLVDRAAERELTAACEQFGVSIAACRPLNGGLLADFAVLDRDIAGTSASVRRCSLPRDRARLRSRPVGSRVWTGNASDHVGLAAIPGGRGLSDRGTRDR